MEVNSENPFKDCQMLKLNGETTDPTIVYLDDEEMSNANNSCSDEEDSNHPIHLKIPSDFNEDDDESNQSMVVEPDDQIVASEVAIKDENSNSPYSSDEEICLKFEPPTDSVIIPPVEDIPTEEQFEVIPENEENNDENVKSDSEENDISSPAAIPQDQSFESTGSASGSTSNDHDHSYSQANNHERTSYCEDIVENILKETDLSDNPKAIDLLTKFTDYLDIFAANEDPSSQIAQYVQRMRDTLANKGVTMSELIKLENEVGEIIQKGPEKTSDVVDEEMPLVEPQKEPENSDMEPKLPEEKNEMIEVKNEKLCEETLPEDPEIQNQSEIPPSNANESQVGDDSVVANENNNEKHEEIIETEENFENQDNQPKSPQIENAEVTEVPMDVSYDVIKEEPMEKEVIVENQVNCDEKKVEIKTDEAEKLQACIKSATDVGNLFTSIQDLSNLVYETEEDIKNGKSKLVTSLQTIIKQSCRLMMEIENVQENEMKIDDFIDNTMLNLCNAYSSGSFKEEEKKSDDDTEIDTDSSGTDDEEINKLCNINALKISKGNRDIERADTVPVKRDVKKKKKKLLKFSDDSDILSSDDEDPTQPSRNEDKSDKDDSSDEEQKMIEKHESKVKNMLLGSTDDDDSDESTYATSESSMGDPASDDEEEAAKSTEKRKKSIEQHVESKSKEEESDSEKSEKSEKEIEKPKQEQETPSKESVKEGNESESPEKDTVKPKKLKQRQMDGVTREIFKKDFLDLGTSDEESKPQKSEKISLLKPVNSSSSVSTSASQESTSGRNDNDAIDLSQYTARQSEIKAVDLTKYIEKKITEKVSLTDAQQPTKPPTPTDDDDCFIISSDSDSEVSSTHEQKTRRRKELSPEELKEETKKAQKAEKERIKKLEKKKEVMSQYQTERLSQQSLDDDIICENDLILDYSKKLKKPIEVHPKLVDKLKNHQKEGIQFMYDNCYGNVDDVKEDNGSGCILAHCMGLGKTLQLITLIHTLTRYPELHTRRILVICPKTTVSFLVIFFLQKTKFSF